MKLADLESRYIRENLVFYGIPEYTAAPFYRGPIYCDIRYKKKSPFFSIIKLKKISYTVMTSINQCWVIIPLFINTFPYPTNMWKMIMFQLVCLQNAYFLNLSVSKPRKFSSIITFCNKRDLSFSKPSIYLIRINDNWSHVHSTIYDFHDHAFLTVTTRKNVGIIFLQNSDRKNHIYRMKTTRFCKLTTNIHFINNILLIHVAYSHKLTCTVEPL